MDHNILQIFLGLFKRVSSKKFRNVGVMHQSQQPLDTATVWPFMPLVRAFLRRRAHKRWHNYGSLDPGRSRNPQWNFGWRGPEKSEPLFLYTIVKGSMAITTPKSAGDLGPGAMTNQE